MARLKEYYEKTIRPQLIERFGYKNPMEVPRLEKIVLNMGVGEAVADRKLEHAMRDMALIAGQSRYPVGRASRSRISRSARACRSAAR